LPRKRSDYLCPKCGKTGFITKTQWTRSSHYSVSDKTTLAEGKWVTGKEKEYNTGAIQDVKRYKTFSKKFTPVCVVHYDSVTGKRKKCYITSISERKIESDEDAHEFMTQSVKSFFQQIIKVLYELSKCPLTPDENKKLDQALRDFEKVFSPDPSDWIKKVFEVYEENGMNPLDEKSIEDKLKDDPYKALELSAKVMGSISFIVVLHELFVKYILPRRLATQNELHSTLSERHFH
jgi:hypothetical protein